MILSIRGGAVLGQPQVDLEVIELLVDLLAKAKEGHLHGLVYGAISMNGDIQHGWEGSADRHRMIAASSMLAHRVLEASRPD